LVEVVNVVLEVVRVVNVIKVEDEIRLDNVYNHF